jgi:hypothetical protein
MKKERIEKLLQLPDNNSPCISCGKLELFELYEVDRRTLSSAIQRCLGNDFYASYKKSTKLTNSQVRKILVNLGVPSDITPNGMTKTQVADCYGTSFYNFNNWIMEDEEIPQNIKDMWRFGRNVFPIQLQYFIEAQGEPNKPFIKYLEEKKT